MMRNAAAFGTGALFAVGLAISGMIKPSKIVGFLDICGAWDARLAFVKLGAIAVHFILYRVVMRRSAPLKVIGCRGMAPWDRKFLSAQRSSS